MTGRNGTTYEIGSSNIAFTTRSRSCADDLVVRMTSGAESGERDASHDVGCKATLVRWQHALPIESRRVAHANAEWVQPINVLTGGLSNRCRHGAELFDPRCPPH